MTQPHCPCLRRGAMRLEEYELREWVRRVTHGEVSRRDFIRTMLGFMFSGPLIAEMLRTQPSAMAQGRRAVQPTFTADDVIFTWEYAIDPATAATSRGQYENIRRIEKLDEHTIKVVFTDPTPRWYLSGGQILPRHLFAEYKGENARNAPYNLKPV